MPRKPRLHAASSIYHVVIRGMDRQIMFVESGDYRKYLAILQIYRDELGFDLFAYCLMSNHVHLLLRAGDVPIDLIFKKINTHYAIWFNMKYQRVGHLQQERFYSEPVEDREYFLNVIRYIHRNPLMAGLETAPGTAYPWSSIHDYRSEKDDLLSLNYTFDILPKEKLMDFMEADSNVACLDIDTIRKRIPDDVAAEIILEVTGLECIMDFNTLSFSLQRKHIKEFHNRGLSIRQINRLTAIPKGIVTRAIR